MKSKSLLTAAMALLCALGLLTAWQAGGQRQPLPAQTSLVLGQPLPGLTDSQKAAYDEGLRAFSTTELRADGLGPVFNGTSCAECHKSGAIGGAAIDKTIARVTRIGGIIGGRYSDLAAFGGPVLQARSLREFDTSCPIAGEVVPPQANFVSHRITTPLFGAGLIESVPAQAILARVGLRDPDGVQGIPNIVFNPETSQNEVGRFGWKAQHSTLHLFAGDAYLNEMGITTGTFPSENRPQGLPIPNGWDTAADPEDEDGDVDKFTAFMQYLAPPGRRLPLTLQAQNGEKLFDSMRCTACHVPSMKTGPNSVAALSNQTANLFSDLLLHRMGPQLADGIQQGRAQGDQFKTAPLWGLSRRSLYLHDGRARDIAEAILQHGGEAEPARNRFMRLPASLRADLLAFLNSL